MKARPVFVVSSIPMAASRLAAPAVPAGATGRARSQPTLSVQCSNCA